jgi:hypothetical protein
MLLVRRPRINSLGAHVTTGRSATSQTSAKTEGEDEMGAVLLT